MLFRNHDGSYQDPKHYPRLSLAQPATHDHSPLAAMWHECWTNIDAGKDVDNNRRELHHMMNFAGLHHEEPTREFTGRFHEAFLRATVQSSSWLAVFQIQDVFGDTARFNVPGSTAATNWSHRLEHTVKQMDHDQTLLAKTKSFCRLVQESGRHA